MSHLRCILSSPITHLPPSTRLFRARPLAFHPTLSIQAQPLMSHPLSTLFGPNRPSPTQPCPFERNCSSPTLHQVFSGPINCLRPNHVLLSATARVSPSPNSFQARSPISDPTVSIQAQPLVSRFHQARLPPTHPCPFERNRSYLTFTMSCRTRSLVSGPTVSIRAQPLVCHFHQALLSPAACLPPNRVNSSAIARASLLHHVLSSPIARPAAYRRCLENALVELHFNLSHWSITGKKGLPGNDVFTADVHLIRVIAPPRCSAVASPRKRQISLFIDPSSPAGKKVRRD